MSKELRWPPARHSRAMRWGILLSLLLHVGLLRLFLLHEPAPVEAARRALPEMTLLLLPAPQPHLAPVQTALPKPHAALRDTRTAKADVPKKSAPQLPTLPQMTSEATETVTNAAPATIHPQPPHINLDAALKMAGKMSKDPAMRDDRAVAQLQNHPLEAGNPDSRLAQDIQRGARADCLNSYSSTGLLAPLFLAADAVLSKKDGGCKW
ncbi:MAG: hypothetical protein ABI171_00220 [Collimonas sp.]|uniref:hypothetical protein n=1 Tax=Collimonas sp. TaxID=1963772 RepID=UPI0032657C16